MSERAPPVPAHLMVEYLSLKAGNRYLLCWGNRETCSLCGERTVPGELVEIRMPDNLVLASNVGGAPEYVCSDCVGDVTAFPLTTKATSSAQ
jgi:hypothetical protein